MAKYFRAAAWGFLWGYLFAFAFFMALFVFFWWHGVLTATNLLEIAGKIFFSEAQLILIGFATVYALYRAAMANEAVRESQAAWR